MRDNHPTHDEITTRFSEFIRNTSSEFAKKHLDTYASYPSSEKREERIRQARDCAELLVEFLLECAVNRSNFAESKTQFLDCARLSAFNRKTDSEEFLNKLLVSATVVMTTALGDEHMREATELVGSLREIND